MLRWTNLLSLKKKLLKKWIVAMKKPEIFTSVLWDLADPFLFNVNVSEEESDKIYEEVLKLMKKNYSVPETYLDWRDLTFDAMEKLGYELTPED